MLLRQKTRGQTDRVVAAAMRDLVRQSAREADEMGPAAVGAAAAVATLGFEILKTTISVMSQGGVTYTGPTSPIGVQMPNKPDLPYNLKRDRRTIIQYRRENAVGVELVNVQFRCDIAFNGPEVTARFHFAPGGRRARLQNDAAVTVSDPLPLKTVPTSAEWQAIGIRHYQVIEIPIEFRVDHPWPADNHEEMFSLVLSGMYGFGAPGVPHIIRSEVVKT